MFKHRSGHLNMAAASDMDEVMEACDGLPLDDLLLVAVFLRASDALAAALKTCSVSAATWVCSDPGSRN